jgi:uncharacterized integral membrane protein
MLIKFLIVLGLLAALLAFSIQNPNPVLLNFLGWHSVQVSVLVIILASLIVGLIGGFLLGWRPRRVEPAEEESDDDNPPA